MNFRSIYLGKVKKLTFNFWIIDSLYIYQVTPRTKSIKLLNFNIFYWQFQIKLAFLRKQTKANANYL